MEITDFPEDYEIRKKDALKAFSQHLSKLNPNAGRDKKATRAKEIIDELNHNIELTQKSKHLLGLSRRLIDKGNKDIVKKLIAISANLNEKSLFKITPQEIEDILSAGIETMVQTVQLKYGEPKIFIGISK
jgi:hypothetical protein